MRGLLKEFAKLYAKDVALGALISPFFDHSGPLEAAAATFAGISIGFARKAILSSNEVPPKFNTKPKVTRFLNEDASNSIDY